MRPLFLAGLLSLVTVAAAASEPPNARAAYVERRGLIEADARCSLFRSDIRAALEVSTATARGALLRAGWTNSGMRELEQAVVSAARARACNDQRTATAAANARTAFSSWANSGSMTFPGWERNWLARRAVRADGWRLSQSIDAPIAATFGVRDHDRSQHLTLILPLARGQAAPSVRLIMRDVARGSAAEIALPQRIAQGLAAGAPTPNVAQTIASIRSIERIDGGRSQAVYVFPDTAFRDLMTLDPRESLELRVESGRASQSLFVEVGDVAAARAFLTIR